MTTTAPLMVRAFVLDHGIIPDTTRESRRHARRCQKRREQRMFRRDVERGNW